VSEVGDDSRDPDEPVGAILARMRRAQGLSGGRLGQLAGMSQPKVSRIENGRGLPDPADIGRLARALGASEEYALALMDRAETAHDRMTDWRPSPIGLAGTQKSLDRWEGSATTLRCFEPTIVQGLLQTSEYARSLFTAFQAHWAVDGLESSSSAIAEAVSARVRRQEILSDTSKTIRFVLMEAVLSNRFCAPADMLAQIKRLREVHSQYDNVSIRIVPAEARMVIPPMHGYELLDDRLVIVDLFNTGLTSQGRADTRLYRQVFDRFEAESVADIGPILDKYQRSYANLLLSEDA
jgi:transcriptional regulator with XRE-family HTH domain